jgi:cysteine-rich repeat protein
MQRRTSWCWCLLFCWASLSVAASGCGDDASSSAQETSADTSSSGADTSSSGADTSSSGADTSSSGADTSSSGADTSSSGADTSSSGADTSSSGADAVGCGDGIIQTGEQCDDGNAQSGDGCDDQCQQEATAPRCGDGAIRTDIQQGFPGAEECDDGNLTPNDGCDGNCQLEPGVTPGCGNGILEAGEQCDDANAQNDDGCLSACLLAKCGDGIIRVDVNDPNDPAFETCDDGTQINGDACPDGVGGTCEAARCGDGFTHLGVEQCDDGNRASGDGCDSTCNVEGACGDGIQDLGEACDLGSANSDTASGACPTLCRTACQCPACGDGVPDRALGEQCDDGNTQSGDGCDSACAIEPPASCGDGSLDITTSEQCDDGNTQSGDGCSSACRFEAVGQTCGDSALDPLEKCDDGNTQNGDGCNPTCNLTGTVTTLATNLPGNGLAVDDRYIWLGGCGPTNGANRCDLSRIDIAACLSTGACTPTVVAGGLCGNPQDGVGAAAVLSCTEAMTSDGTTLWFGNQHTLRALDIATNAVTTVAGSTSRCAAVDGVGLLASFHDLRGLTYDAGAVFLLDGCENVVRRFDPATAIVTTIAGQRSPDPGVPQSGPNAYQCSANFACQSPTPADGFGAQAVLGSPRYMTSDRAGTLYITDTNGQSLRAYNKTTGWLGTLVSGQGYQDGLAASARLSRPRGVASDGTSLYWSEQTAHTVRQVTLQSPTASTLIGVRGCPGARDGVGGDASRDWSAAPGGCASAPSTTAQINNPFGGLAFHFPSRSLLLIENRNLRRIE